MARYNITLLRCYNSINVTIGPRWCRLILSAIFGIILGVTISIIYAPFSTDSCANFRAKIINGEKIPNILEVRAVESDTFQVKLRPQQKHLQDKNRDKTLVRPRYAATELDIREKLFVAVITSKKTIGTLGVAINKTIHQLATQMVFFMDEKGPELPLGMSVVSFSETHLHLIPIHVLKFISEHYPETYDYYMLISDKAYIREDKLMNMVNHISVSQDVYMGVPLMMKDGSGTYCLLDGGIIFSRSVLSPVFVDLDWCFTNSVSMEPSINLGHCLQHSTKMNCRGHAATKSYATFNVSGLEFNHTLAKLNAKEEFRNSITVFPMSDAINQYKYHRYYCQLELNETKREIETIQNNIINTSQFVPGGRDTISWPVGVPDSYKPQNQVDVIRWDYFTENHIYFQDDFTNSVEMKGADKLDIQEIIKISVDRLNEKYGNTLLYSKLVNGYRRFDPQRGMEYTMDLSLRDISKKNREFEKRVHMVRPLGGVEIIPMPYETENKTINMILPVTEEDSNDVTDFLDSFTKTCLDKRDDSFLLLVFVYKVQIQQDPDDIYSVLKSLVSYYERKYHNTGRISWVSVLHQEDYMSDLAVVDQIINRFDYASLMLVCSVGMVLDTDYFNRVRINTVQGWQVFFPIGFWQYKLNLIYDKKPFPTTIDITSKSGRYDTNSYEHSSFYVSDYNEMRALISAAKSKENDVYDMFIQTQKLHVFRANEPSLKHRYKYFNCPSSFPFEQLQRCLTRRSLSLASGGQLSKLVSDYMERLSKHPQPVNEADAAMHKNIH